MVEVNGAYKQGSHETIWLKSLRVISNVKVFAMQNGQPYIRIKSGWCHTSNLKIGTPVATLPGAWHCWVNAGTGWPGVSILWLGEMESLICSFYLSTAARKIV